jgi:hypothetical protein
MADKVRENRIRQMAARRGFRVQKSRRRDPGAIGYGRFQLIDAANNMIVLGSLRHEYDATLDEIESYLAEGHKGVGAD